MSKQIVDPDVWKYKGKETCSIQQAFEIARVRLRFQYEPVTGDYGARTLCFRELSRCSILVIYAVFITSVLLTSVLLSQQKQ